MKKRVKNVRFRHGSAGNLLKKMKLLFTFFFAGLLAVSASTYSQQTKLSLRLDEVTVREVFKQIEERSEFVFFYNEDYIDVNRKVNIDAKDEKVESILGDVLKGTKNTFKIYDRQIVILSAEMKELPPIMNSKSEVQQKKEITGVVKDAGGFSLPGVSVVVKGTTTGTITDVNGQFSLSITNAKTLVFSFVGMKTQEVSVEGKTSVSIVLEEEAVGLEEVVAVGYGTQRKVNLTGSVSSVNFDDLAHQSRALTNVSTLLTGMSSGVRTQQSNGTPSNNNETEIRIRGVGSLNASSAPLVLVDGQVADINSVSPNDVASVSILKDAASAAIYGSRASNGVILITTKSGKDTGGKITFNLNSYGGKKEHTNKDDLISYTPDFMKFTNLARANSGATQRFTPEEIEEYIEGGKTDPFLWPSINWMDEVTKENIIQNHHLSGSGGNQKIGFYTALDYLNDDGLVYSTGYKRMNFRNNINFKVNNWLKLGSNFTFVTSSAEPASDANVFMWMRASQPAVFPKNADGRFGAGAYRDGTGGANHPRLTAESQRGEDHRYEVQGKVFVVLTPLDGLNITGSYFNDLSLRETWKGIQPLDQWNFRTDQIYINRTTGASLSLTNTYSRVQRQIYDLYADYTKSFGDHNFAGLAGFNQEYYISVNHSTSKTGLLSYDTPVLDAASLNPQASGTATDFSMRSFFGRLSYNFKGKYLLETNLRYDGSSRFAPDKRWGLFPSFSGGWVVSKEEFWAPLSDVVSSFKLRASWGTLGNNGIGNYEWQSFYTSASYAENNNVASGLRYNAFGNPSITWENTKIVNIGADFRLLNNLTFDINYYDKKTDNILSNIPIPLVNGGITAPRLNSAVVLNRGLEAEVKYSKNFGKLSINIGANYSYNNNKILKYKGDLIEVRGNYSAWTENQPIGIFYVMEVDHIVQNISEIDALVADGYTFFPSKPGLGDFLYKDNNKDKIINTNDRVMKGNPIPVHVYGGNLGFEFAGFDFNAYFDGVAKWDRYLQDPVYNLQRTEGYAAPKEYLNSWTLENPSTKIPKLYTNNPKNNQVSDYYLRSAAYTKVRSMQIGYSLPSELIRNINFERVRVYANVENPFYFTKWPSFDPEMVATGTEFFTYPLSRTISLGINVSF